MVCNLLRMCVCLYVCVCVLCPHKQLVEVFFPTSLQKCISRVLTNLGGLFTSTDPPLLQHIHPLVLSKATTTDFC